MATRRVREYQEALVGGYGTADGNHYIAAVDSNGILQTFDETNDTANSYLWYALMSIDSYASNIEADVEALKTGEAYLTAYTFGEQVAMRRPAVSEGITTWTKVGYNPSIATTEEDVWSYGGTYVFPTAETAMEVRSDDATADADIGTILFTGTCDDLGSTTQLLDAGVDFTATAAVGDYVIVDKAGAVPEWGVLTAVANGSVTFANGLSSGGTCFSSGRTYQILDSSAATGAMAVIVCYLDGDYAEKCEIVILNTTTEVPLVNTDVFRVNSFRVVAVGTKAGATNAPKGNLELRKTTDTPIYSYITKLFTRARNQMYTVPDGKTLYVFEWNIGWATPNDTKVQTARFYTRANIEPSTAFNTGSIFYPYTETIISNAQQCIRFPIPTRLPEKTDIKVSGVAFTAGSGPAASVLRGLLVTN